LVVLVLLASVASALLVRFSPGSRVDERELDPRMSPETVAALRAEREAETSLRAGFLGYWKKALRGDLGESKSRNAPIMALLVQNAPATLRRLGIGLAGAWFLGLGLAIVVARFRGVLGLDAGMALAAGILLSLPAAVLAYLCLTMGAAVDSVLMLVLAPRVFRFSRNLLLEAYGAPHIGMARARGIGEMPILFGHVLRGSVPQMLALLAASLSMAVGAIIPIEAMCDAAGLGRLAWQAAMSRDLPLLLNLTMLISLLTTAAMMLADLASPQRGEAAA
jgi:ABC-type dipeptide/oligopeptide/nickel transport system permease component